MFELRLPAAAHINLNFPYFVALPALEFGAIEVGTLHEHVVADHIAHHWQQVLMLMELAQLVGALMNENSIFAHWVSSVAVVARARYFWENRVDGGVQIGCNELVLCGFILLILGLKFHSLYFLAQLFGNFELLFDVLLV